MFKSLTIKILFIRYKPEYVVAACVQTPGPGHYGIPNTDTFKKKSPSCTLIGRRDLSCKDITPGPGAHSNDNVIHSIAFTLTNLHKTRTSPDSEGPRDAPRIRNIALEKARDRGTTFKDT